MNKFIEIREKKGGWGVGGDCGVEKAVESTECEK